MRVSLLLCTALATSAFAEAPSVAVVDFMIVGGDARLGSVYAERLAARLGDRGLKVVTQDTIRSMLSLERQKQLLGCAEDTGSCAAELAGALGSTYVLLGQVAKVGSSFSVNVRAVRSADGSTVSSTSKTTASEDAALAMLNDAADAFVFTLDPTLSRPSVGPWVVAGIGVATAAVGAVFIGRVASTNALLRGAVREDLSIDDAFSRAKAASIEQPIGISLLATGGAAIVTGIVWWALSRSPRLSTALAPFFEQPWFAFW
jgi:TolB-like protein